MLSTKGLPKGHYRVIQMDLDGTRPGLMTGLVDNDSLTIYHHGLISRIVECRQPQLLLDVDWADDPVFHKTLAGYSSIIAVPLHSEHTPMSWVLLVKPSPGALTVEELEETVSRSVLIGSLIDSQSLAGQLANANKRIEMEMSEVGKLQRSLLPDPFPVVPGLRFAVSYEPSGRAGGDIYDVFPLDDSVGPASRWCILIGDASGHGIAAAVVMAIIHTVLHSHPLRTGGPAKLLHYANQDLCEKKLGGFVTLFLAIYEPATGRLIYCSAGHPAPLHRTGENGVLSELNKAATHPIGIDPEQTFEESSVQLAAGDMLLLYTDGVTEARSPKHEMLDLEPLQRAIRDAKDSPADAIKNLRAAVIQHQHGSCPVDDQTMVVAYADSISVKPEVPA